MTRRRGPRSRVIVLDFTSTVTRSAQEVWATASTMDGVNDELSPWIGMTVPRRDRGRALTDFERGVGFDSWLLALRLIPFDRHRLGVDRVIVSENEYGFDERSTSWVQREWLHRRRIRPLAGGGCEISDHLEVTPRTRLAVPVVRQVVSALFRHRHQRLRGM